MYYLLLATPWVASVCGALMLATAVGRIESRFGSRSWKLAALVAALLAMPTFVQAAADLQTSVEAGNAVIMYLCGILAAVGVVAAGVAMMMGRQAIAKWAFAGAMISGLGFAI